MENIGDIAGRMMEAWLLDRAEALDAGRGMPPWASIWNAEGAAAVLPDALCPLTEEKGAGVWPYATPAQLPEREDARREQRRGATVGESTVGDAPRAARGRRRWD